MALGRIFYKYSRNNYKALKECTPAEVQEYIAAGVAPKAWQVGDYTSNTIITTFRSAILIGFDHNKELETAGQKSAHFMFPCSTGNYLVAWTNGNSGYGLSTVKNDWHQHQNSATNVGGWSTSICRTLMNSSQKFQVMDLINTEWTDIMTPCTKYTDNVGGGSNSASNVTATVDKLFIPSEFEVYGERYSRYSNKAEYDYQVRYTFWENGANSLFYQQGATTFNSSTRAKLLLRSPACDNATMYCVGGTTGLPDKAAANISLGAVVCFAISA